MKGKKPVSWLLVISFLFSIVSLAVYLTETGFSDENLFLLLVIIRYSSFLVFVSSLYKLFHYFYDILFKKNKIAKYIIKIIILLLLILYCFGIFFLEGFITVFSGGME